MKFKVLLVSLLCLLFDFGECKRTKVKKGWKNRSNRIKSNGNNRQSCDSGVTSVCLEAAKDVLIFEAYQRNNFLKQFTRFVNHNKTKENKRIKKEDFEVPKKAAGRSSRWKHQCNLLQQQPHSELLQWELHLAIQLLRACE